MLDRERLTFMKHRSTGAAGSGSTQEMVKLVCSCSHYCTCSAGTNVHVVSLRDAENRTELEAECQEDIFLTDTCDVSVVFQVLSVELGCFGCFLCVVLQ